MKLLVLLVAAIILVTTVNAWSGYTTENATSATYGAINASAINRSLDNPIYYQELMGMSATNAYDGNYATYAEWQSTSVTTRIVGIFENWTIPFAANITNINISTKATKKSSDNIIIYCFNTTGRYQTVATAASAINIDTVTSTLIPSTCIINNNIQTFVGSAYDAWYYEANMTWNSFLPYINISQTYNASTYETNTEGFSLNISYDSSYYTAISANLIYNGTSYPATISGVGNNVTLSKSLTINAINTESENKSFYWQLNLFNGTGLEQYNTSLTNQTINRFHLELCNATYPIKAVNFTAYREDNLTRVRPFSLFATLNYWLGDGTLYRNLSINNGSLAEQTLCIKPEDKSFYLNGLVQYGTDNSSYLTRDYYFANTLVNNITTNISLYLLEPAEATTFILQVQDINQLPMNNTYIKVQRYYPATDSYETVQIAKTGSDGKTVGFYETETVYYRHIILSENGTVLLTTERQKIFGETVPYKIIFTIGEGVTYPWSVFENKTGLTYGLSYNKTSKLVTYSYADSSTGFTSARLFVVKNRYNTVDLSVCNQTSSLTSAVITCNLSSYSDGSFTAKGYVTRSGSESVIEIIVFDIESAKDVFGKEGLFLAFFIILCAGMLFLWHPVVGIWAVTISVVFVNLIKLASFPAVFVFSLISIAIIVSVVLKAERGYG